MCVAIVRDPSSLDNHTLTPLSCVPMGRAPAAAMTATTASSSASMRRHRVERPRCVRPKALADASHRLRDEGVRDPWQVAASSPTAGRPRGGGGAINGHGQAAAAASGRRKTSHVRRAGPREILVAHADRQVQHLSIRTLGDLIQADPACGAWRAPVSCSEYSQHPDLLCECFKRREIALLHRCGETRSGPIGQWTIICHR